MATILCIDDEPLTPQLLAAQLAHTDLEASVVVAPTVSAAIAQLQALAAGGQDLPLVVAHQALTETAWLEPLYRLFPQALTVSIGESAGLAAVERLIPQGQLYRCLALPLDPSDLRLTLVEALRRYRYEQALGQMQADLEAAHQHLAHLTDGGPNRADTDLPPSDLPTPWQNTLALSASAAQKRAILSALPDITSVITAQGQYVDFSLNGFTGEEVPLIRTGLAGKSVTDAFPPEVARQWLDGIEQALATGETQSFVQQLRFGDRTQYEEVRIVPYQDDLVLGLVRDISDRKIAEVARQESERQLQHLVAGLPGAVFRYVRYADHSDGFTYMSAACEALYGITAAEAMADPSTMWNLIHPDDVPLLVARTEDSIQQPEQAFQSEHRIVTPGGEMKWVRVDSSQPRQLANGGLEWSGFVRDITAQKQVELDLQRNRELQEAIFNESADALFLVDATTDLIVDCNDRAVELFQAEGKATLVGTMGNRLQCRPFTEGELAEARQIMAQQGFWNVEVEYATLGGQRFWGSLAAKPMASANTNLLLVRVTDITAKRRIEAQIRDREQQLQLTLAFTGIGTWRWYPATGDYQWSGPMGDLLELDLAQPDMYQQWRDRIHPDDVVAVEASMQTALANRQPFTDEYRYRLNDGSIGWRWVKGQGCYNEAGDLEYVLGVVQDTTAPRQIEAALRESEQRRQLALDLTNTGSWEFDVATGVVVWSDSHYRLMGLSPSSQPVTYPRWRDALHPDDRERTEATFAQAMATATRLEMEYRVVWPDGTAHWVLSWGQGIYDNQGQPLKMIGVMVDIGDRKAAEIALKQSQDQLQMALNFGQIAIWSWDAAADQLRWNDIGYRLWGIDPSIEPLTHDHWLQAIHPEDRAIVEHELRRAKAERRAVTYEYRVVLPDGTQRWIADRGQTIYAPDDQLLGAAGVMYDITQRKTAQLALQESETRFRQLAETVREGFFVFDGQTGHYEYTNPAFDEFVDPEALAEDGMAYWLNHIHPDDRDQVEVAAHQQFQGIPFDQEYRFQCRNNQFRWIRSQGFPLRDAAGVIVRIVGTVEDISERKRTEQTLALAEERYRRATQAAKSAVWELNLNTGQGYLDPNFKALAGYTEADLANDSNEAFVLLFPRNSDVDPDVPASADLTNVSLAYGLNETLALIHPEDRDFVTATFHSFFAEVMADSAARPDLVAEYRLRHRDGSVVWVLSRGQIQCDDQGRPTLLLGTTTDITDLKRAEQALQQLNHELEQRVQQRTQEIEKLAAIVENSTDFIGTANLNGEAIYLNRAGRQLVGLPLGTDLDQPVTNFHHPAAAATLAQEALPTAMQQGWWRGETTLRHQGTGDAIAVEQIIFTISDPDTQQPVGLATMCRDIRDRVRLDAERQQAELALKESEARFRQITETIEEVFWMTDADGSEVLYVSPAFDRVWGFPREAVYQSIATLVHHVHPDDAPRVQAAIAPENLPHYDEIYRIRRPDGQIRWLHDRAFPIVDDHGEILRIVGVASDITERQQAVNALKESEERFRGTFEQSALGIVEANLEGCIVQVNEKFCQMIGYSAAELRGKTYRDITYPEDIAPDDANVQRLLSGEIASFEMEKRYLRADGSVLWVILAASMVRDGLGQPQYLLGVVNDIGDRKRTEQALQESRQMLQLVLDTIPQRVFWKDRESRYLGCNSAFARDLSRTPDQVVGQTDADLGYANATRYQREDAQILYAETPRLGYEEPLSLPTDLNVWTRTTKVPLTNTDGEVIGVLGCYEDISEYKRGEAERKQAETALQESRNILQLVLNTIPQRVFWKDRESRFLGCNATFSGDFQLTPEQIVGKTDADMPWAAYAEAYRADDAEVIATQTPKLSYEELMGQGDDGDRWILTSKIPLTNTNGEVIGVLGCYEDISDRKQAETALRESRQMLQLVLDTIPQRVFWKDRELRYLGCNAAFVEDSQLAPEQIIGKTDWELPWADHAEIHQADDTQVIVSRVSNLGFDRQCNTGDGNEIWIRTSKVPLTNADSEVIGVLGCYEDISDRKQAEEALKTLNQELEQRVQNRTQALQLATERAEAASQAKSMFLANMSHELRTPLNAILGFSQLMAREADLGSANHRSLEIINRSGEHLLELINDILEMAKIEAGQLSLNPVDFDLDALLNAVADLFDVRARGKGLDLIVDRHPALPGYLRGDEAKLRQVLINLISNAVKFTSRGQICLRAAATQEGGDRLEVGTHLSISFTVSDTGIGIATADLNRLLEPFAQAHQGAGINEGTGLGLAISRQFVRLLGGEITIESQPGLGSAFTFTIPMAVAEGKAVPAPEAPLAQVAELVPGQPTYRILVADDDPAHRHLLSQLLRSVGFEVDEAQDGQGAIALWESWHPDLIWLDMRMPMISGYEVTRHIRTQEQAANLETTKIIALTANAFADDRDLAFAQGCNDFVSKPFQLGHVLMKMAEHLGVEYTYRAAPQRVATAPLDDTAAIAALGALPPALLAQLYDATLKLDSEALAELIEQIAPDHGPLADLLHQHLEIFAFDTIHTLLQQLTDR